ncbi:MAG: hypothetical protein QNL91_15425, partial [Candidatus Krumholzibacteria bacterium]|nr:hypothetical protein [Candidatus Krumholzibacteria bacterium]
MLLLVTVLAANPAAARVVSGSYTGDGSTNRPITGLGFRPAVVIVKGDLAETGVIRTDIYQPGNSKQMCAPAMEITDGIMDFTADGFTVDQGVEVNSTGVVYHWVALSSDPGTLDTGYYWGDGTSDRWLTGVGFRPEVVMVFRRNGAPVQFRTADMQTDFSTSFEAVGLYNNHIRDFAPDAFRLGSDSAVNGPAGEYAYIALNADAAKVVHGIYNGSAPAEQDIGPLGFGP